MLVHIQSVFSTMIHFLIVQVKMMSLLVHTVTCSSLNCQTSNLTVDVMNCQAQKKKKKKNF